MKPWFRAQALNRAPRKSNDTARWIPRDEVVHVWRMPIYGGWFYFGTSLRIHRNQENDPSLVALALSIRRNPGEPHVFGLHPRPSYDGFGPDERRGYLDWLSGSRRVSVRTASYVHLYFFGLERRLLVDRVEDANEIAEEIRRLERESDALPRLRCCASRALEVDSKMRQEESDSDVYHSASGAFQISLGGESKR